MGTFVFVAENKMQFCVFLCWSQLGGSQELRVFPLLALKRKNKLMITFVAFIKNINIEHSLTQSDWLRSGKMFYYWNICKETLIQRAYRFRLTHPREGHSLWLRLQQSQFGDFCLLLLQKKKKGFLLGLYSKTPLNGN